MPKLTKWRLSAHARAAGEVEHMIRVEDQREQIDNLFVLSEASSPNRFESEIHDL